MRESDEYYTIDEIENADDDRFYVTVFGNCGDCEEFHAVYDDSDDAMDEYDRLWNEDLADDEEAYIYQNGRMIRP